MIVKGLWILGRQADLAVSLNCHGLSIRPTQSQEQSSKTKLSALPALDQIFKK